MHAAQLIFHTLLKATLLNSPFNFDVKWKQKAWQKNGSENKEAVPEGFLVALSRE